MMTTSMTEMVTGIFVQNLKSNEMTQSLINNGKTENKSPREDLKATPKWICADDFRERPANKSGVPRMELARTECDGEQFLVIFDPETGLFTQRETCEIYTAGSLEIKIVEIV
jgi:hypothetical protein